MKDSARSALTAAAFIGIILYRFSGGLAAQAGKKLTFEQAFLNQPPVFLKTLAAAGDWLDDESYLLPQRDDKGRTARLLKVRARTGEKSVFVDYDLIQKNLPDGVTASSPAATAPDFSGFLFLDKDDLFYYSLKTGRLKRLTATPGEERNPRFSPNGRQIAYTRADNLFALDIGSGLEYQITADASGTVYNGRASWVYYEEILGRRSRYAAFWWSPDSTKIAFLRFDDSRVPVFNLVRSSGVHGELETQRYPKPGDPNPKVRLGIAHVPERRIVWADVPEEEDHYLAWPFWLPDGSRLTFQWLSRDQTNLKIFSADPATGAIEEVYEEKQPAWVEFFEDLYIFKDGSGFLLRSDKDGWSHLYDYDLKGNLRNRLTSGEGPVTSIALVDEETRRVFFVAKEPGKTAESHLFRVNLDGSGLEKLTHEPGTHRVSVSPGGSYFLDTFTSVTSPARQDVYAGDGTFIGNIDRSRTPLFSEYALGKVELFNIPTDDGWNLPALWVLPPCFDENKKYPVLFSIYGGPGSASVSNSFPAPSAFYYAQEGIIHMAVDHRGSGHFGKKGVALMHRSLGKWEMHDYIQAVKWLLQKPFVDKSRIGITGSSYGGYATCMALTYGADYFTHGLAGSSVTDWRLYDSVYTERYMDLPSENEDGYALGSVLTHAAKLRGILHLTHGDMDDNVHMQNAVQLIDRLMDLGKTFSFALYPGQRHGFSGAKNQHSRREAAGFWLRHLLQPRGWTF
jgi:dipeptidyl-peptidase-4